MGGSAKPTNVDAANKTAKIDVVKGRKRNAASEVDWTGVAFM